MDFEAILAVLAGILTGAYVKTIAGLIVLDVALGVAEAIKTKTFDWQLLADFYRTMVLPYVVAFAAFAAVAKLVSAELLGPWAYLVGDGMVALAWLSIVASVGNSILAHLKGLAIPTPEP